MRSTVVRDGLSEVPIPMVDGVAIRLADGKDWVVPPLRIDQLLVWLPLLTELASMSPTAPIHSIGPDNIDAICGMIAHAMTRNYPDMTSEKLRSLLDMRTIGQAVGAVISQLPAQPPTTVPQKEEKKDG